MNDQGYDTLDKPSLWARRPWLWMGLSIGFGLPAALLLATSVAGRSPNFETLDVGIFVLSCLVASVPALMAHSVFTWQGSSTLGTVIVRFGGGAILLGVVAFVFFLTWAVLIINLTDDWK